MISPTKFNLGGAAIFLLNNIKDIKVKTGLILKYPLFIKTLRDPLDLYLTLTSLNKPEEQKP